MVCLSVCLCVMTMSPAAELIKMSFLMWTGVGPKNHVLDLVEITICEWAILRAKRCRPRTRPDMTGG